MSHFVVLFAAIALIVCTSSTCLLLLRAAGFASSGRAVVAGAVAGLLIGPTVLGRVWPSAHEALFLGTSQERQTLEYARWYAEHVPSAIKGIAAEGAKSQLDLNRQRISAAEDAFTMARARHELPLRVFSCVLVAATLLVSWRSAPLTSSAKRDWVTSASVGVWSFALPAAVMFGSARHFWGCGIAEAAGLAAAVGIGPLSMSSADRISSDKTEIGGAWMVQAAGRISTALAIVLCFATASVAAGIAGAAIMLPLLVPAMCWVLAAIRVSSRAALNHDVDIDIRGVFVEPFLAATTATVALRADLLAETGFWPTLVCVLIADDGRWLAAFLAVGLLGGRSIAHSLRLVTPAVAAGPTQLAVTTLGAWSGIISNHFVWPLLAGVIVIELTEPLRRRMTESLPSP